METISVCCVIFERLGETDIPKESRSTPQVFAHLSPFSSTRLESKTLSPLALRCITEHHMHVDQSTQVGNNQAPKNTVVLSSPPSETWWLVTRLLSLSNMASVVCVLYRCVETF